MLSQNGVFIFVIQRKRSTNRWLVHLIGLCVSVVFRWNLIGALFEVGRWITIIIDYYKKYPHWLLTHSVHVVRVFLYINDTFLGFQYCCSIRVSFWRNLKWPIDFAWSDFRSETTRLFVLRSSCHVSDIVRLQKKHVIVPILAHAEYRVRSGDMDLHYTSDKDARINRFMHGLTRRLNK